MQFRNLKFICFICTTTQDRLSTGGQRVTEGFCKEKWAIYSSGTIKRKTDRLKELRRIRGEKETEGRKNSRKGEEKGKKVQEKKTKPQSKETDRKHEREEVTHIYNKRRYKICSFSPGSPHIRLLWHSKDHYCISKRFLLDISPNRMKQRGGLQKHTLSLQLRFNCMLHSHIVVIFARGFR